MKIIWMITAALMILLELLTFGNLITIWFFFGSIAALITTFLTDLVVVQVLVFTIVTILSLVLVRPMAQRILLRENPIATNADRVIGKELVLEKAITQETWGQVSYSGTLWSCVSENNQVIKSGEKVEVVRIDGVKLVVKKI